MVRRKTHLYRSFVVGLVLTLGVTTVGCGSSGSGAKPTSKGTGTSPATESSDFGTLKNVCHEATGTNKPGAEGEPGVTADSITITTISDANSELQKGLNQELWDAATVFTRWCNENGGINGRTIKLIQGDAQVVQYSNVIDQACKNSFALVGGGGAFDNTGTEARVKCGLIALPGFVASAQARGSALMYPAMATGVSEITTGGMRYLAEHTYKDISPAPVATVYGDFETTQFTIALRLAAAQDAKLALEQPAVNDGQDDTYNPMGLPDWRPTARSILDPPPVSAADGSEQPATRAKGLLFSGQPLDLGKLITALGAEGAGTDATELKWVFSDENAYDQVVIRNGRSGLERIPLYVQTFIYPFEEAGQGAKSKGMDDFLALFDKYLPDGKSRAMFAVSGFASWLLFAETASACGDTLTRACLEQQVHKIGDFNAGGLIAPRDPAKSQASSKCYVLLKATPEGFERVAGVEPTEGGNGVFNCSPLNVSNLSENPNVKPWIDKSREFAEAPAQS